jgi:hypothetical protein
MVQETIDAKFEVESPAKLKLRNIRGSVEIQGGSEGFIEVTAVKYLKSGNSDRTEIKIEQADDGSVDVTTEYENPITNWFGAIKPCKVDYVVKVPEECDVRASGVSCNLTAKGLNGIIDISSVSGGLILSDLSGSFNVRTVSGSIKAERFAGELDANSVSGRIRVMQSQLPKATLKTVSGSMVVETPLDEGPYIFKGVSGNVTLVVPEDTGCIARSKSVSGRLRTSLNITKDRRYGSRGLAEIQSGGPEVISKSVSGSLRIVKFEDEVIVERKESIESPAQQKNQIEILQKIESGDITVEDALKELNA